MNRRERLNREQGIFFIGTPCIKCGGIERKRDGSNLCRCDADHKAQSIGAKIAFALQCRLAWVRRGWCELGPLGWLHQGLIDLIH